MNKLPYEIREEPKDLRAGKKPAGIRISLTDITDRKHAQMRLIESEIQYRTLADSGQALIWTSGTDSLCNYVNQPWLDFTGRSLELELGNGWTENIHPDDFQRCQEIYVAAFYQRQNFSMDFRIRHHSGEYRWIQKDGCPRYDSKGQFLGYIGHCLDIGMRRESEQKERNLTETIRKYAEEMLDLYKYAPCGYHSLDEDGVFIRVNDTELNWLGYTWNELVGKRKMVDFLMPDSIPLFLRVYKSVTETGEARELEVQMKRKDGTIFPALVNAIAVYGRDDGQFKSRYTVHDLSERKKDEIRRQFAVESLGGAMWEWDANDNELFLSAAAEKLFTLPTKDVERPIADLINRVFNDDRDLVQGQVKRIMDGEAEEWLFECRLDQPDGGQDETPRWISTHGRVMIRDAHGKPQRITSISRDVTLEKNKIAEEQRLSEIFAHQARMVFLGEMSSVLAHEINQPLAAICGFAASCARKVADNSEAIELVQAIENQAIRLGDISWRICGYARRRRFERCAVLLPDVIFMVVKWIRMNRKYRDIEIDLTGVAADLPPVLADHVELEQVLINLVHNGIEAGSDKGLAQKIAISADLGEQPGMIEVRVSDWGCGLPDAAKFNIFQKFSSTKEEGLGLGLAVSFSITERHGGRLWATANPEGGSIFHLTLPCAK